MLRFSKYSLFLLLALAAVTAEAMPIGVRIAVNGRAAAQEAVNALFPALDGEVSAADVADALSEAEDVALAANITDANGYAEFREWAKCTGAVDVKASGKAWLSYALGTDALIGREITSNDVQIVGFDAVDGGAMGTSGVMGSSRLAFAFEVAIDGVNIGGGSVAESVLKENLKKVLGIEGAKSLSSGAFSSDNIDITFDTPVDGKAKFTVSPPADAGNSFFMRVKVK